MEKIKEHYKIIISAIIVAAALIVLSGLFNGGSVTYRLQDRDASDPLSQVNANSVESFSASD